MHAHGTCSGVDSMRKGRGNGRRWHIIEKVPANVPSSVGKFETNDLGQQLPEKETVAQLSGRLKTGRSGKKGVLGTSSYRTLKLVKQIEWMLPWET